ncbi:DUF5018 domain-containing protein [Ekhidna sp. To15]|uniref:DUF5018 domain-containing protein n=1 Tax=Ekhidna sp. To15 TaxID=3395267 RepID=UPI003F51D2B6
MTRFKNLITIAALMMGFLSVKAQVSGTFTVGPGADYETLPLAFTGINSAGGLNGDVILELQSDYAVTDFTTLTNVTGILNYSITIRPASDVTDLQINHDFRLNGTDNLIFDGSNPSTGDKVVQINGEIRMYTHVRDVIFRNLKFNVQGQFAIYGSNGGAASGAQYWDDITIENNEFFTETPTDFSNTVYVIYSYPVYGSQSTWPENILIQNNKFYGFDRSVEGSVVYIRMRNGVKAYNNVINHKFSEFLIGGTGINHSFGHGEAINNTIHFEGGSTSQLNSAYGLSFAAGTGGSGVIANNIISIKSSANASSSKRGISTNNNYTYNNNNIYIYDDGVSTNNYHASLDQEGSLGYSPTVTFSEPFFTDIANNDFSLTGASLTNPDFRSFNNSTGVTTDHNGDARHSTVPSKGAFEAQNMIADITAFNHASKYEDAVIDRDNSTVLLEVVNGTDITNIGPSLGVYYGGSSNPTSATVRDFTTPQIYTVTAEDGVTTDVWTASVVHQNDAPTDITLNSMSIDENSSIQSLVGGFSTTDVDVADVHSYELVAGEGSEDNGLFTIDVDLLGSNMVFDYESENTYSIRVRSDDNVAHGGTFEKMFTISINDLPDETPTAINLDNDEVVEGAPIGTLVGLLTTDDIDVADDHVYTLVSGTGDSGNSLFDISGDQLVTAQSLDFADESNYSVRIRTTDNGDAFFEQSFTINIKEVNDGPQGSAAGDEQKITPSTRYSYDYFGEGVAISDGFAIIGAKTNNFDENEENYVRDAGAAYIYEKDEMGDWSEVQKITEPIRESYNNFGKVIAMDGNYAVVGVDGAQDPVSGNQDGLIYIYERNASGIWEYKQTLSASGSMDDGIDFGYAVDISGDYLVASALYDEYDENGENNIGDAGAAYIFERNASGVWNEVKKIVASDRDNEVYYYGESVAISGNYIAIGAPEASSLAEDGVTLLEQTGAIYVYERDGSGEWNEVTKAVASDRDEYDYMGYTIDIDGETLVVGNENKGIGSESQEGVVYVFSRTAAGVWEESSILTPDVRFSEQSFGRSVRLSDGSLAIGSYFDEVEENNGIYIFTQSGSDWIESDIVAPTVYENSTSFGEIFDLDGKELVVGEPYANFDSEGANSMTNAGAAYIFELCTNADLPTITASITEEICAGTAVTLSITDASLNDALSWEWYSESCGGTPVGSGTSIEVSPSTTTTYYARGEGACANSTTCSFITIEVYEQCPENDILAFEITNQLEESIINTTDHTVVVSVPFGTDLTALSPTVTVSPAATVNPVSGSTQNFESSVVYTVTSEDGASQDWTTSVIEVSSTATDILSFTLADQTMDASINSTAHTVTIEVERGTDLTNLAPTLQLSPGASSSPESGVSQDFSTSVTYTITAEDGITIQDWNVSVTEVLNSENDILAFVLNEQTSTASIDDENHTISVEVITGTDITSLTPTITLSEGASISPTGAQDFTDALTYTVTAEDGLTTQVWTITVTVEEEQVLGLENLKINVYPNPSSDFVNIEADEMLKVQMIDLNGRVLRNKTGQNIRLNLKDIKSGMYILQITDGETSISQRIIKAN